MYHPMHRRTNYLIILSLLLRSWKPGCDPENYYMAICLTLINR